MSQGRSRLKKREKGKKKLFIVAAIIECVLGAPHAGVYGSGRSTNAYCTYCVSDAVLTLSRASSKAN